MRSVRIAVWLSAALTAFVISATTGGIVGAAAFILALFSVPVIIGFAIVAVLDASPGRAGLRARIRRRRKSPRAESANRCGECGGPRLEVQSIYVCVTCDHVAAGA